MIRNSRINLRVSPGADTLLRLTKEQREAEVGRRKPVNELVDEAIIAVLVNQSHALRMPAAAIPLTVRLGVVLSTPALDALDRATVYFDRTNCDLVDAIVKVYFAVAIKRKRKSKPTELSLSA